MLTLIYYFTFINFLLITIFGSKISRFFTWCFTVFSSFFSLAFIFFYFFNLVFYEYTVFYVNFGLWFKLDCLTVSFGFLFDALSTIMCFTIIFISLLVQIYSYCYMFFDQNLPRFLSYLSLFTFFMLILVTADNFAVLFIGWEGVGLCSFLLISFWSCRVTALKSALKAILVNRIGDFFLLFGICFIYNEFNSLNFLTIFNLVPYYINCSVFFLFFKIDLLNCVSFLLLLGAVGKSAQIGLHVWLPDAMEGPTPVSALIHAATMVTAGVFVIIRCSFFFEYAPKILFLLIFFGSLTSIFAGLCATIENDIKKIIAYSTCSQLGYMFFSCGFSSYSVSLFHLFNHAFFKALLFLCAGVIIHALSNEQNIIHMGSLKKLLPFTYCATLIGLMSLTGFPFLSGFYSKELILLVPFLNLTLFSHISFFFGISAAVLTSYYSYRLFYYVFICKNNMHKQILYNIYEENIILCVPLLILIFFSIISGYLFKDLFVGFGSTFFNASIFILPQACNFAVIEQLPFILKILPFLLSVLGWGVFSPKNIDYNFKFRYNFYYNFFKTEGYFTSIYNIFLLKIYHFFFINIFLCAECGLLHFFGPQGFFFFLTNLYNFITSYHSGYLYNYLCILIFSLLLLNFFLF